jgi:hypothetical protein
MGHTAKLAAVAATAILGLGLPAIASAQQNTSNTQATAPQVSVADAMSATAATAQRLAAMEPISADNIIVVSLSDNTATGNQLAQQVDPSAEAALQRALKTAQVLETGGSIGGYQRSLAQHIQMLGYGPANVVTATIGKDKTVTLFTK